MRLGPQELRHRRDREDLKKFCGALGAAVLNLLAGDLAGVAPGLVVRRAAAARRGSGPALSPGLTPGGRRFQGRGPAYVPGGPGEDESLPSNAPIIIRQFVTISHSLSDTFNQP